LKSPNPPEFWLLNNGITVLTAKTETGGFSQIEIHDPQIVNGLQTSRQIYNHFSTHPPVINSSPPVSDERRVLVRVIKTDDRNIRDEVIRCTNSQNEMPEEALRATDAIHRQLETAFHTKELYYDRRKGHYRDQGKPVSRIVSVIDVLQAMLSIVLQRPDDARARPRDYIKNTTQYKSVFGEDLYQLTLYLKTTEICRRITEFLEEKQMESIHRRNINFYLCMYASCELIASAYAIPNALQQVDVAKLSDQILERCYKRVWKKYETLADKFIGVDGQRDYDAVAKGQHLLKGIQSDLKRRFAKKQ
jgi:hypothetical protein